MKGPISGGSKSVEFHPPQNLHFSYSRGKCEKIKIMTY
jgi:hypothetical protein